MRGGTVSKRDSRLRAGPLSSSPRPDDDDEGIGLVLWFPIVTWFNSVPGRSLDTSAVSFTFRSAGEEFEYDASIVLSILTIDEQ